LKKYLLVNPILDFINFFFNKILYYLIKFSRKYGGKLNTNWY